MEHFAGLDVSMKETHVCVVDREGEVVLETMATTLPEAIAEPGRAPSCQRVVFETGRMAPHSTMVLMRWGAGGLYRAGRPSGAEVAGTHKTDRNDARGLAHLAAPAFKPVYVNRCRPMPSGADHARKKLVGQRSLENQIRGLAVVWGPAAGVSPAFATQVSAAAKALQAGLQWQGCWRRAMPC
jgi:hypothetical protein